MLFSGVKVYATLIYGGCFLNGLTLSWLYTAQQYLKVGMTLLDSEVSVTVRKVS